MSVPTLSAALVAGVLTVLTPCCLPVLPPLLSGSVGHSLRPVTIVAGSIVSFTAIGIATGYLGLLAPDSLRAPAFLAIVAFGAVMADDDLHAAYSKHASRASGTVAGLSVGEPERHPVASAFAIGLGLGVLWLPCVGPVLGAVLAYASTTNSVTQSGLLLGTYGVGFGLPLLAVAYGSKLAGKRVRQAVPGLENTRSVRRLAGYVLVLSGVGLLFGLDRAFLSLV
jgi:cytochrome c biogenesis protein CcdA